MRANVTAMRMPDECPVETSDSVWRGRWTGCRAQQKLKRIGSFLYSLRPGHDTLRKVFANSVQGALDEFFGVEDSLGYFRKQPFLGAEIPVDERRVDVCVGGDLTHTDLLIAALAESQLRRLEYSRARPRSVAQRVCSGLLLS